MSGFSGKKFLLTYQKGSDKTLLLSAIKKRVDGEFKCLKAIDVEDKILVLIWSMKKIETTNPCFFKFSNNLDPKVVILTKDMWNTYIDNLSKLSSADDINLKSFTLENMLLLPKDEPIDTEYTTHQKINAILNSLEHWTVKLLSIMAEYPSRNLIYWVHNLKVGIYGCEFLKNLSKNKVAYVVHSPIKTSSNLITKAKKLEWSGQTLILDLKDQLAYEQIKQLKSGMIPDEEGSDIIIDIPHVFVFADYLPNKEKLRPFDLIVWELVDKHTLLPIEIYFTK